jgi:GGDEF domain-containing protein
MHAAVPSRRAVAILSIAAYAFVFAVFRFYERIGLGLGHFYYVAIALAALAGGTWFGVAGGALAAALYMIGVAVNPHMPTSSLPTEGTLVRAATYIAIGGLIGWFATRHRQMVAELRILADRDTLTGLPNTRAFEAAVDRRLKEGRPFLLVVAELTNVDHGPAPADELLRAAANHLLLRLEPTDEIARIGTREFAVIVSGGGESPRRTAGKLEALLAQCGAPSTVGWASHPRDAENALSLYRAANERLYARKIVLAGTPRRALQGAGAG